MFAKINIFYQLREFYRQIYLSVKVLTSEEVSYTLYKLSCVGDGANFRSRESLIGLKY